MKSLRLVTPHSGACAISLHDAVGQVGDGEVEAIVYRGLAVGLGVPHDPASRAGSRLWAGWRSRCGWWCRRRPRRGGPVKKSSEETVPPNGMSRWVCTSMPPGMTYLPLASMVVSPHEALPDTDNLLVFDQHVGLVGVACRDDRAASDQASASPVLLLATLHTLRCQR